MSANEEREMLSISMRKDGVLAVRLNRPDVRNAFNTELIHELRSCFEDVNDNADCRALLLSGEGKSFSAGADIDWMKRQGELSREENIRSALEMAGMFQAIYSCRKPVLAAIHGAALGGGTGLAAVADIAITEDTTLFGFTEVRLGILPAVISPYVVEKIGTAKARALFITGSRFDGREAERIGLVFKSVPEGGLQEEVEKQIAELCLAAPRASEEAKTLAQFLSPRPPEGDLQATAERIADIRRTAEAKEGLSAFLDKRKPAWIEQSGG